MNKNVYGIIGIRAIDCNWNASWSKEPKMLSDGTIYGSDKALKYAMRHYWKMQGEKIMYTKTLLDKKGKIQPATLEERYIKLFNSKEDGKVRENLYTTTDVRQFGCTFTGLKMNLSGTGVVQIGIGRNIYERTIVEKQKILSPFRNSNEDKSDAIMTSNGEMIFTDEAHYCYPFAIMPDAMNEQIDICPQIVPYSEEDYMKFVEAASVCATALNSCSKIGAENEYFILIESYEDKSLYLGNLRQLVKFEKVEGGKDILNIDELINVINSKKESISKVKIYYNHSLLTIDTKGLDCETGELLELIGE